MVAVKDSVQQDTTVGIINVGEAAARKTIINSSDSLSSILSLEAGSTTELLDFSVLAPGSTGLSISKRLRFKTKLSILFRNLSGFLFFASD